MTQGKAIANMKTQVEAKERELAVLKDENATLALQHGQQRRAYQREALEQV